MSNFKRFMWCPWFFTISLKTNMFYEKLYPIIGGWSNQKNKCFNIQNCPTGISDCHNIISVTIKRNVPVQKRKIITYRSYKNFDTDSFDCDLENISFPDIENLSTYLYYILKIVSLNIDQFFNQMKKSTKYLTYFNLHV